MTRWLYHALVEDSNAPRYAPASLATEGFVHCSFAPRVRKSIALYFAGKDVEVWRLDPRLLDVPLEIVETPRGPMPHVVGSIPRAAIVARWPLAALPAVLPDEISAT